MNIGYIGEHKATKLIIALSPDLKDATSYKIEFSTCGKVIASNTVTASNGVINYAIPQDITLMPIIESVMGIQVIGNNGENIIKSPIVEAYIGSSLLDSTEVASNAPTDISTKVEQLMAAKHSHSNKAVLDKFAESEDGKPTYDGEALGGGGGASTAEDVSYTNAALPNISTVGGALDALVPKSHTHANKDTLDKLSDSNGKLQYNGSDVGLKGDKGADGKTPVKGTDYWTAADKAEIVTDTLAALPKWTGGSY